MAKPEWGVKRQCLSCAARFYDLNHDPIACPECGATFEPEALARVKRMRASPRAEPIAKVVDLDADVDEVDAEDDDVVLADDEDEDDALVVEDEGDDGVAPAAVEPEIEDDGLEVEDDVLLEEDDEEADGIDDLVEDKDDEDLRP